MWFEDFINRNKWKLCRRYPKGTKLFTRPSSKNLFGIKRRQPEESIDNILAFEAFTPKKCEQQPSLRAQIKANIDAVKNGYLVPIESYHAKRIDNRKEDRHVKEACDVCHKQKRPDKVH